MPGGFERRGSPRRKDTRIIRFNIEGRADDFGYGITGNISSTGLWFYTAKILNEGETLILSDNELLTCDRAIVRWSKEVERDMYQVGLQCERA